MCHVKWLELGRVFAAHIKVLNSELLLGRLENNLRTQIDMHSMHPLEQSRVYTFCYINQWNKYSSSFSLVVKAMVL